MIPRYVTGAWCCMRCPGAGTGIVGPSAQNHAEETGHPTQAVFIVNYLPGQPGDGAGAPIPAEPDPAS